MKKETFGILVILLLLFSCNEEANYDLTPKALSTQAELLSTQTDNLKENFSKALMKVLREDIRARTIIKDEALKKIDYDYDVIYAWIKNINLEDGRTLESHILKYMSESAHDSLLNLIPNLTIFIPTLPENSFSPNVWDINSQAPSIAYINKEKRIKIIYTNDTCKLFPSELVPGFPVLVVKPNERLAPESYSLASDKLYTKGINTRKLKFIDDCFNNIDKVHTRSISNSRTNEDNVQYLTDNEKRLIDAFNTFKGSNLGWQRDFLYYGLTPQKDKGPFNYDMNECLVGFEFVADALTSIRKVCDAGDPQHPSPGTIAKRIDMQRLWTDGDLEFMVKTYYGSKSGAGTEKTTYFIAKPNTLFQANWQQLNPSDPAGNYRLVNFTNKKINLDIPLFDWNLNNYSSTIKIAIEEVDNGASYTTTNTQTVEFATNFSFDVNYGDDVKVGLKYGQSSKESKTVTYTYTVKDENDALGEVLVNFADDVITSDQVVCDRYSRPGQKPKCSLKDYNRKYYTGWYRIYLAPHKMN